MTHASLFTGIGGFDLAASWMGWQNLFTCEIDGFCNQILKYYFKNSTHYGNIRETDFTPWRGRVDVLTGGFPCQPFSLAGNRKGADDDRYLWPEMLRAIREIRPAWVVAENVAGITSMVQPGCEVEVECQASLFEADYTETILQQEYVIETICRDFEREGYSVQPVVIPACAVGAPHRRDRIWFIAHANCKRQSNGHGIECEREVSGFKERIQNDRKTDGYGRIGITQYPNGKRCQELDIMPVPKESPGISSVGHIENWRDWPTQSPVCRNDDGLSLGLDGITFSKWRNESIKAYGNAIVPQVAYEIFKAIRKVSEL